MPITKIGHWKHAEIVATILEMVALHITNIVKKLNDVSIKMADGRLPTPTTIDTEDIVNSLQSLKRDIDDAIRQL